MLIRGTWLDVTTNCRESTRSDPFRLVGVVIIAEVQTESIPKLQVGSVVCVGVPVPDCNVVVANGRLEDGDDVVESGLVVFVTGGFVVTTTGKDFIPDFQLMRLLLEDRGRGGGKHVIPFWTCHPGFVAVVYSYAPIVGFVRFRGVRLKSVS